MSCRIAPSRLGLASKMESGTSPFQEERAVEVLAIIATYRIFRPSTTPEQQRRDTSPRTYARGRSGVPARFVCAMARGSMRLDGT